MPNTVTPATTVTAIAQTLTLTSPTTCRVASFSAISRLRCLSWSEELIANPRLAWCYPRLAQFARTLAAFDEAHADARDFARGLTGKSLGAAPVAKTSVIA